VQVVKAALGPAFDGLKKIVSSAIQAVIRILQGFATMIRGVVKIITGILTLNFGRVWDGIKDIFSGGVHAVTGFLRGAVDVFKNAASAIGRGLASGFSAAWDKIKDIFEGGKNALISIVNFIIDEVINRIPGVQEPTINTGGKGGGGYKPTGSNSAGPTGFGSNAQKLFSGGMVNKPMAIVGEEAPRHPEYVLATNPAYRRRNLGLWQQAGAAMGVPGFAKGGALGIGKPQDALRSAGSFIGDMAKAPFGLLPDFMSGTGEWVKDKFADYIRKTVSGLGDITGSAKLADSPGGNLVLATQLAKKMGLSVTSTTRSGSTYHNPDYNPPHQAFDFSNGSSPTPEMMAFARAAIKTFGVGNILELFYNPLGYQIDNYRKGPMTVMDHYDHVHLAFKKGGVFGGGGGRVAGGGSGRQGFLKKLWKTAAPYFHAKRMPSTRFVEDVPGDIAQAVGFEDGSTQVQLENSLRGAKLASFAIHEWAHAFQTMHTQEKRWLKEGSALGFENLFGPKIAQQAGLKNPSAVGRLGYHIDSYHDFFNRVLQRTGGSSVSFEDGSTGMQPSSKSLAWLKSGQFGYGNTRDLKFRKGGVFQALAAGGIIGRPIPKALQKYNHLYGKHVSPDYGGERMPKNAVAMLAEFFGMPGFGMAAIASRESGFRPGAVGDDAYAGYGNTFGYGLWQITNRASGLDSYVSSRFGGYDNLLNPIANAIVAAKMYKTSGYSPWGGSLGGGNWSGSFGDLVRAGGSSGDSGGDKSEDRDQRGNLDIFGITSPLASGASLYSGPELLQLSPKNRKILDLIKKLQRKVPDIKARIANAEILDAMSTSPMGSELSTEERVGQMGLWQGLIDNLVKQAALIPKLLPKLPKGKLKKKLKGTLATLNDITGGEGSILSARVGLDNLLEGAPDGLNTENFEEMLSLSKQLLRESNLRYAVSQAQYKVLADVPYAGAFRSGGVVPGPIGQPTLATVHGGETVVTREQSLGGIQVIINGDIVNTPAGKQAVEIVRQGGRRMGQRVLPGAGGR
jgi:hypothetical protein